MWQDNRVVLKKENNIVKAQYARYRSAYRNAYAQILPSIETQHNCFLDLGSGHYQWLGGYIWEAKIMWPIHLRGGGGY